MRKIRDRLQKTNNELKKTAAAHGQSPGSQSSIPPCRGSATPGASYVPKSKAGAIRGIQVTHANGRFANKQSEPAEMAGEGMLSAFRRLGSAGGQPREGML